MQINLLGGFFPTFHTNNRNGKQVVGPVRGGNRNRTQSTSRLSDAQHFSKTFVLCETMDHDAPKAPSKSEELLLSLKGCGLKDILFSDQDSPDMVNFRILE